MPPPRRSTRNLVVFGLTEPDSSSSSDAGPSNMDIPSATSSVPAVAEGTKKASRKPAVPPKKHLARAAADDPLYSPDEPLYSPAKKQKLSSKTHPSSVETAMEMVSAPSLSRKKSVPEVPNPAGAKRTKPSSYVDLGSKIYDANHRYMDLGYVVASLRVAGVRPGAWSTRSCSFIFRLHGEISAADWNFMKDRSHYRLIVSDSGNCSYLIPCTVNAAESEDHKFLKGNCIFPGPEKDFVDSLRHFGSASIRSEQYDPIPVPEVPKKVGETITLKGKKFRWSDRPVVSGLLSKGKSVNCLVDSFSDIASPEKEVKIDVIVSEGLFLADQDDFADVPEHGCSRDYGRLKFLFECGRKIDLKENPFLEDLVVEKNYDPRKTEIQGPVAKVFGEHIQPKVLNDLFALVRNSHADQQVSDVTDPQHESMNLKMHEYQKRAVSWMMLKERASVQRLEQPNPLYIPFETVDGERLFTHYSSGRIVRTLPKISPPNGGILADEMGLGKTLEMISLILANPKPETVARLPVAHSVPSKEATEEFQCVCAVEPRDTRYVACAKCGLRSHKVCVGFEHIPKNEQFLCITCQRLNRIESATTLVVAPQAILHQWINEIEKSADGISVYEYEGIKKKSKFVSPWLMSQHDVVIASYETLSQEILFLIAENRKASLRKPSLYAVIPSPLMSIKFWRFVLDEAQMVESQSSNYAQMAMKIHAQFYWAVTGTPIQRGISDLRSLLNFIEVSPWNRPLWFVQYLAGPFNAGIHGPLHEVLANSMWRLEKADVENEMNLPKCTTVEHIVRFTGIEKQLYQQVYHDCVKRITGKIRVAHLGLEAYDQKYAALSGDLFKVIRTWVTNLQKLCISPTRVGYIFSTVKKIRIDDDGEKGGGDSLARVADTLLKRAKDDLANAVRLCIMTKNALGGLYWLDGDFALAAESYREAKALWRECEQHFTIDASQKLHILSNLGNLVTLHAEHIPPALENDDLLQQADVLRQEACLKHTTLLEVAIAKVKTCWTLNPDEASSSKTVIPHSFKQLERAIGIIYAAMKLVKNNEEQLVYSVRLNTVRDNNYKKNAKLGPSRSKPLSKDYGTGAGLQLVLQSRWDDILKSREDVCSRVAKIIERSSNDRQKLQAEAAECHLRVPPSPHRCDLCKLDKAFDGYEDLIFTTLVEDGRSVEEDREARAYRKHRKFAPSAEDKRETVYDESEFEVACKAVITFVRRERKTEFASMEDDVKEFTQLLGLIRKEQLANRDALTSVFDYVGGLDELRQAEMRIRIMTEDEHAAFKAMSKSDQKIFLATNAVLDRDTSLHKEITRNKNKYVHELAILSHSGAHFRYISNMHDAYTRAEDVERRECCICLDVVEENWALLPCYHILCVGCLNHMQAQSREDRRPMMCPLCRKLAPEGEIVSAKSVMRSPKKTESRKFSTDKLRGCPSKMEEVVTVARELLDEDPRTKILVFSEFSDVLMDYEKIFRRVNINSKLIQAKGHIPKAIEELREDKFNILLMPVALGGKGLTIIEANHVFFLEPVMNKAAELQAIGRIYRMGQTRPTFVHRFIVEDTIEEKINEMMSNIGAENSALQQDLTLREILNILKKSGHHGPVNASLEEWVDHTGEDEEEVVVEVHYVPNDGAGPSTSHPDN